METVTLSSDVDLRARKFAGQYLSAGRDSFEFLNTVHEKRVLFFMDNFDHIGGDLSKFLMEGSEKERDALFEKIKENVAKKKELAQKKEAVAALISTAKKSVSKHSKSVHESYVKDLELKIETAEKAHRNNDVGIIQKVTAELTTELDKFNKEVTDLADAKLTANNLITPSSKTLERVDINIPSELLTSAQTAVEDLMEKVKGNYKAEIITATKTLSAEMDKVTEHINRPKPEPEPATAAVTTTTSTPALERISYVGGQYTKKMLQAIFNKLGIESKQFPDVIVEIKSRYTTVLGQYEGVQFIMLPVSDPDHQVYARSSAIKGTFLPLVDPGAELTKDEGIPEEVEMLIGLLSWKYRLSALPSLAGVSTKEQRGVLKEKIIKEKTKEIVNDEFGSVEEEVRKQVENDFEAAMQIFETEVYNML